MARAMQDWKAKLAQAGRALARQEQQQAQARAQQAAAYRRRLNQDLDQVGKDTVLFAESMGVDCEWRLHHQAPERFGFTFRIPATGQAFSLSYPEQAGAPEWEPGALQRRLSGLVRAAGEAARAAHPRLRRQ